MSHEFGYEDVFLNLEKNPTLGTSFRTYDHHQDEILIPTEIELPRFHLKICNNIAPVYYTGIPAIIEVVSVNALTGEVANCGEAVEVEVDVVEEKFEFEDNQESSPEYLSSKIVKGKDGRSLLKDTNRRVLLKEGVGSVKVTFKHSSQWFGKCRYRFGARIVGDYAGTRIREAKTEAFWVKDRRCMSKRDRQLLLTDKIWKIEGIGQKGRLADLLSKRNIVTVKDFLVEHNLYLDRLKLIFEEHKFLNKFEAICEHALSCKFEAKRYLYPSPQIGQTSAVFNSVGELLGIMPKGGQYVSVEEIYEADKVYGQKLVALAFQNWNYVKPYVPEKKRQQTENLYQAFYSSDKIDCSCSNVGKKQKLSERDPAVERATTDDNFGEGDIIGPKMDLLSPDNTSVYDIPTLQDNFLNGIDYIDNIHDQPCYSPSGLLLYDDECFVLPNGFAMGSEPRTAFDVYLTKTERIPWGKTHNRWMKLSRVFKFISRRVKIQC